MTDTERLRRLDRENEELRDMLNQVAWRLGLGDEVHYYSGDNYLACQLRVLDAVNGLIERESDVETVRSDAMDAWRWVCDHGGLSHVKDIYHDLRAVVERLGVEWSESELHGLMDTLDSRIMPEGMEVRESDTVYEVEGTGHAYEVVGIRVGDGDPLTPTVVTCDVGDGTSEHFLPGQLTHERPDSWELLEEDVAGASFPDVYCANHHIDTSDTSYEWAMARDIVRRAKALAGRDA